MVAPPGFEPGSTDPESDVLDHYTTGLLFVNQGLAPAASPLDVAAYCRDLITLT